MIRKSPLTAASGGMQYSRQLDWIEAPQKFLNESLAVVKKRPATVYCPSAMGHDAGDLQAVVGQSELELCKLGELHGRIENMVSACACVMNAKKSMMNLYCRTGQQLNGRLTDELWLWTGLG